MPSSRQQGLLLLPLFFHEFGHVLYCFHQEELDNLIKDFQSEATDLLTPKSIRDDIWTDKETEKRNRIVEIWYNWLVEIFCDAVGFTIGGSSFLNAFSIYFRLRGSWEFQITEENLWENEHPVSWLRIKLVADRAKNEGCSKEAKTVQEDWGKIAKFLGVNEDYYGFFSQEFRDPILRTVNDMLIEVSPYKFSDKDMSDDEWDPASSTPIHLLNKAWFIFSHDPENYQNWEKQAIEKFLKSKNL